MSRSAAFFLWFVAPILALLLSWLGFLTLTTNLVGWFLLIAGIVYSVGILIAYAVRRGRLWTPKNGNGYSKEERGDRSFWFIALGIATVFYLSPIEYLYHLGFHQTMSRKDLSGITLILLGIILFIWAHHTLGKGYSGHASVKENQSLVQTGPYQYVRHPSYLGYLLIALGITLGYWSLAGLISVVFLLIPSIVYRISVEEKLLGEHFGKDHHVYTNKVKRLIPRIW